MQRLLISTLLLAGTVCAQPASYTYIEQPPPYSNPNPPWLTALNLPRIGQTFSVSVPYSFLTYCESGGILFWVYRNYFLLTGATNPRWHLMLNGMNGIGVLYTSAEAVHLVPVGYGGGFTQIHFAIPNDRTLLGAQFFQQVVLDEFSCPQPFARLGRGGHGVIGT